MGAECEKVKEILKRHLGNVQAQVQGIMKSKVNKEDIVAFLAELFNGVHSPAGTSGLSSTGAGAGLMSSARARVPAGRRIEPGQAPALGGQPETARAILEHEAD